jgi:hypothetical protein
MANLKHLSTDPRFRDIVQKHMTALSREIAQELTQPLLAQLGLTLEDLGATPSAEPVPVPITPPEWTGSTALLYDAKTRRWTCPRCRRYSDLRRRSVTTHLRFCDAVPATQVEILPSLKKALRKSRKPGRQTKSKKKS